jgi:hypothetical protein
VQITTPLPPNATASGTQDMLQFAFYPDYTQSGDYTIGFECSDVGGETITQDIQITVTEAGNQPPFFSSNFARTTSVPSATGVDLHIVAVDPEFGVVTLTAEPILDGATFTDNGDGTGDYSFYPDTVEVGNAYDVLFIATDNQGVSDSMLVTLEVVSFLRGDFDSDSRYTMNDLSCLIDYLFRHGEDPAEPEAADVNNDQAVNMIDITYMIRFLYQSGPPPPN